MMYDATFHLVFCMYSRSDTEVGIPEALVLVDNQQTHPGEIEAATLQARQKLHNAPMYYLGIHRTNCPLVSRPEQLEGKLSSNGHVQWVDGPAWRLVQYNM